MVSSASPLQDLVRETRRALDELILGDQLVAESWRRRLAAARRTVVQLSGGQGDRRTVRSVRAVVAAAAREEALAAQFESRLVRLSSERLREVSAQLERSFASLEGASAESSVRLAGAAEDLLAELRAELAAHRAAVVAGGAIRYQERLVDDVVAAMRAHGDRIEQLLLELAEAAQSAVGARVGGLLPTRESHVPPRLDLDSISAADVAWGDDELSRAVGRSIDLFRDRLSGQVEDAIETLRTRIDSATQCHALGGHARRERADDLAHAAQHLMLLSERFDWMLFDDD